ncbi:MAG TPA: BamA/TamA family outer membrane protein [Ferruginibacter sp.]|nr:BamA/TamA family outer membrane protein [Ferruginibacter sp.]
MKVKYSISLIILLAASSCSVQRFLPPGERLYNGSDIIIKKHPDVKQTNSQLKKHIKLAVTPHRNKFILGQPYKVWWWYVIGEPKNERGLKPFLRRKLGEAPVLSSRVNAKVTAENLQAYMENTGYFHSTIQGDTINTRGYFMEAVYTAYVQPQYHIKSITWVSDSSDLMKLLEQRQKQRGNLKVGQPYRLSDISTERDQLDLFLKTRGYYYFNPDYLMAYADSTVGNRQVDLLFNLKKTTPESAKYPYRINEIILFPNYTLASNKLDTNLTGATRYDGLIIKDTLKRFKPKLFAKTITYRPGNLYNSRTQNSTLNRFISLGAFKFVKNRFEPLKDSGDLHRMNVYYYMTPAKTKSFQGEIDAFSKENNSLGAQVSVNWKHRNLFRGAELLTVKAYAGFEVTSADSLRRNNSFRIGGEARLKFPHYAVPFLNIKENNFYPPNTSLLLAYEMYRKQLFYTKNLFRLQYDFTWKTNIRTEYTLAPVALSYMNASNVSDTFYKQAVRDPIVLLNVYSEAIVGSFFTYTYSTAQRRRRDKLYFNAGIDLSGNILGLAMGAKNWREKTIFGTPFAQYIKTDLDLHYTRTLTNKWDWASRIQIGLGNPYGNSRLLPFAKQYIIGGSSSIRGFRVRSLGPGTYKPTAEDQRFFQIIGGDYKFLVNSEIRIPLTSNLHAAVFADAGNIWTKDTLIFGKAGQLSREWINQLAVATGVGLRFDAVVLIIRADLGIPLRKPYLPAGQRWVFNQIDFGSRSWRRENLILNIALGLPF